MSPLIPSRRPPDPVLESAGDREVLLDRVIATVVDVSICYLLFVVPVVFVPPVLSASFFEAFNGVVVILSLFLLVPIHQTYAFAFEWRYSRTPGKVARGLMVTTTDGGPCSVGTSAVRNIGRYVDFLPGPYFIGLASALLSANGQRIGDMAANTVVVRAKSRDNGATTTDEMRGRNSSS